MLNSIRSKDKMYKVKKVMVSPDNTILVEASNVVEEESVAVSRAYNKKKLMDLDSQDETDRDDEDDDDAVSKKKKKNSVRQYKEAINQIGSKSSGVGTSLVTGKKVVDKVIVTESEYNLSDKWLINDMEKKAHKVASSSKRKYSYNSDLDDDDEESSSNKESDQNTHKNRLEDSDEDFDFLIKANKKTTSNLVANLEKNIVKSPISKKRFVDSNYEERQRESLELAQDAQEYDQNVGLQFDCFHSDLYNNFESSLDVIESSNKSSNSVRPKNDSPVKLKGNFSTK